MYRPFVDNMVGNVSKCIMHSVVICFQDVAVHSALSFSGSGTRVAPIHHAGLWAVGERLSAVTQHLVACVTCMQ